jgi:hypothetical protein
MIILALDPGYTTGWCKIEVEDKKPKYIFSGNIDYKDGLLAHAVTQLLKDELETRVVIERLPYGIPPILRAVEFEIKRLAGNYDLVAPSEWKPITRRYPLPKLDWRTSRHERDAWRMGVFWLWREGLVRI